MVERRSTASKGKNSQRAERLKRTFQSQEMHVFRMNGLTEELAGLFKILKEKKRRDKLSEQKTDYMSTTCKLQRKESQTAIRILSSTTLDTYTKPDFVV